MDFIPGIWYKIKLTTGEEIKVEFRYYTDRFVKAWFKYCDGNECRLESLSIESSEEIDNPC